MDNNKDIDSLIEIAKSQNYKINLSMILISLKKVETDAIPTIMEIFADEGIEVITGDVEIDDQDITSGNDPNVIPFDPSKIEIESKMLPIDSILKKIKYEELELDSSFQRKPGLWSSKQKSQLIESLLLKIPLPTFYFDASNDDKWQIIDGLQRVSTLKEFAVDQSLKLIGMEFLKDLNGLTFEKLPRSLQRRLEETNIYAYIVKPTTPKNVKFNIFKRINTGGLVLEPQEIRNALYQGQASEFLLKLSKNNQFLKATGNSIKPTRMLDREFCLRYVIFTELNLDDYTGNLDDFLNSGMDYLGKISSDQLNDIEEKFSRNMNYAYQLFEQYAFRKVINGRRGPVNKSFFEMWSHILNKLSNEQIDILVNKKSEVQTAFFNLFSDYTFMNYIKASDKTSVNNRINTVFNLVNNFIEG
ncbi:MAG: DUF262 domain-containing protein [Treponema sp.]|nr:DUF262 domain-containing protein [Treponema sp.]